MFSLDVQQTHRVMMPICWIKAHP